MRYETLDVLDEIRSERHRQDVKWGEQNHPDGTGEEWRALAEEAKRITDAKAKAGTVTWLDIAREEVLEAFAETDPHALEVELVQGAAVLAQWVEAIRRRKERTAVWGPPALVRQPVIFECDGVAR